MKVEKWSDILCPFCYIGKNNFEKALEQLPFKDKIQVKWKSFQLDPSLPNDASNLSIKEYLIQSKGISEKQIDGMFNHLIEVGNSAGITFNHDKSVLVNTYKGHQLIHFAQDKGKGSAMEEALFKAYFTESKNVGNTEVLVSLAESVGLDKVEVLEFLNTTKTPNKVEEDIAEASALGISSIPFFVLDGKYVVSGAQPVETFVSALTKAFNESTKLKMKEDSNSAECSVDGCEI